MVLRGTRTFNPGTVEWQGMGDIVKFRKARKRIERQLEERRAAENRVRYGRGRAERAFESARTTKARRDLELHRIETGDDR